MRFLSCFFLVFCMTHFSVAALNDVPKNDPDYAAINTAVNQRYFSLYNGQFFKPDHPLSRREAAQLIQALTQNLGQTATLSATELRELTALSNSFKQVYSGTQSKMDQMQTQNKTLLSQQALSHADMNRLSMDIDSLKKQRRLLYGLIALSGLLGVLF